MNAGFRSALVCLVLAGVHGCRSGSVPPPDTVDSVAGAGDCRLFAGDNVAGDTLILGCNQTLDRSHAPVAANETERLLFRQIYETLVRVDCRGRLQPGLARSWESRESGRVWEFRLRKDARFSDGSHLTAVDVRNAWGSVLAGKPGPRRPPWTWIRPESVRTVGEDRLWVALPRPLATEPVLFAHPELAVARPGDEGTAPLGSGPYAWAPDTGAGGPCALPNRFHPESGLCVLCVVGQPGADPRDLLSGGVDLVIVAGRDALEYAENLPGVSTAPLPWSRLYLLLSTALRCAPESDPGEERMLSVLRDELASKVAGVDAQPARFFSFDPEEETSCLLSESNPFVPADRGKAARRRIVYWEGDEETGRIAARLVALEAARGEGEHGLPCLVTDDAPVAAPVSWSGLLTSLTVAADWVYVVAVRRNYADPCLDLEGLRARVQWVGETTMLPLLVSRSHLVIKTGVRGVTLDRDGMPVLNRAGWDRTGTVP